MNIRNEKGKISLAASYPRVDELVQRGVEGIDQGFYPGKIFNDPEVYQAERERIWAKAWIYLGHVSEIPNKNDYVLRNIADDPLIVVRGQDGVIRAMLNACTHRGGQLCRADRGNSKTFRCPYHGWMFANTGKLMAMPCEKEAYGTVVNKEQSGMVQLPKLDVFQGLIFGCLDPDAMSLDAFLGDMKWYLEILTNRTVGGLEVLGAPQRWIVAGDWKQPADNFVGDSYHTQTAHQSIVEIGLLPPDPLFAIAGEMIDIGKGHGCGMTGSPSGVKLPPAFAYPTPSSKKRVRASTLGK